MDRIPRIVAGLAGFSLMAAIIQTPIWTGVAEANVTPCTGSQASRFAGGNSPPTTSTWGVRADIEFDPGGLCGSNAGATVTWAALASTSAEFPQLPSFGIAQAGYGNFASGSWPNHSGFWVFSQDTQVCVAGECTDTTTRFDGHTDHKETYNASYKSAGDNIHMYHDGTQINATDWSPMGVWDSQWHGEFAGETKYLGSDVSGVESNPIVFQALERQTSIKSATWSTITTINLNGDVPDRYHRTKVNPSQSQNFQIWTKPLNALRP